MTAIHIEITRDEQKVDAQRENKKKENKHWTQNEENEEFFFPLAYYVFYTRFLLVFSLTRLISLADLSFSVTFDFNVYTVHSPLFSQHRNVAAAIIFVRFLIITRFLWTWRFWQAFSMCKKKRIRSNRITVERGSIVQLALRNWTNFRKLNGKYFRLESNFATRIRLNALFDYDLFCGICRCMFFYLITFFDLLLVHCEMHM